MLYPGEEDVLYQLCDTEDSSDEVLEQSDTKVTCKQASQVTQAHFWWDCSEMGEMILQIKHNLTA